MGRVRDIASFLWGEECSAVPEALALPVSAAITNLVLCMNGPKMGRNAQ